MGDATRKTGKRTATQIEGTDGINEHRPSGAETVPEGWNPVPDDGRPVGSLDGCEGESFVGLWISQPVDGGMPCYDVAFTFWSAHGYITEYRSDFIGKLIGWSALQAVGDWRSLEELPTADLPASCEFILLINSSGKSYARPSMWDADGFVFRDEKNNLLRVTSKESVEPVCGWGSNEPRNLEITLVGWSHIPAIRQQIESSLRTAGE